MNKRLHIDKNNTSSGYCKREGPIHETAHDDLNIPKPDEVYSPEDRLRSDRKLWMAPK